MNTSEIKIELGYFKNILEKITENHIKYIPVISLSDITIVVHDYINDNHIRIYGDYVYAPNMDVINLMYNRLKYKIKNIVKSRTALTDSAH